MSKQTDCDLFNAKVKTGNRIRVWPALKEGPGLLAEVLGDAYYVKPSGTPWVPIRYLEGRRSGGTDHIFLSHASTIVEA